MKEEQKSAPNQQNRRRFIKSSFLGGLFLASGVSVISCNDTKDEAEESGNTNPIGSLTTDKDWLKVRKRFILTDNKYFFNTASIGPTTFQTQNKVIETMTNLNERISSGHKKIAPVRDKIAKFLNVEPSEIALIRNTTEGMNIIANSLSLKKGDEVIISSDEHIGGAAPWLSLQKEKGIILKVVQFDNRNTNIITTLEDAVTKKTKAISLSHILCTTGEILPVKQIVEFCRKNEIVSCMDGAQALGAIPIDLNDINPDFYTTCGHKWLFGPEGTGVLYVNKERLHMCKSHYVGAYSDSKFDLKTQTFELKDSAARMDYGTRNVSLTVGLGEAIDLAEEIGMDRISARGKELAEYFIAKVKDKQWLEIITPISNNKFNSIVTFRLRDKDNLTIVKNLRDEKAIFIRGIYENDLNAMRMSFAIFNTKSEIDFIVKVLEEKAQ